MSKILTTRLYCACGEGLNGEHERRDNMKRYPLAGWRNIGMPQEWISYWCDSCGFSVAGDDARALKKAFLEEII